MIGSNRQCCCGSQKKRVSHLNLGTKCFRVKTLQNDLFGEVKLRVKPPNYFTAKETRQVLRKQR